MFLSYIFLFFYVLKKVKIILNMGGCCAKRDYCIFCDYQTQKIVLENERLVLFEDIAPMAKHHFLCIPKEHIVNINSLTKEHIPMLEEMREMATNYLLETYRNEGVTKDNIVFGFHIPPFTSISHLHMHCVILPYNNFYYVIMNDYLILRTLDQVIDNLKKESK